jgi:hypothetical protein
MLVIVFWWLDTVLRRVPPDKISHTFISLPPWHKWIREVCHKSVRTLTSRHNSTGSRKLNKALYWMTMIQSEDILLFANVPQFNSMIVGTCHLECQQKNHVRQHSSHTGNDQVGVICWNKPSTYIILSHKISPHPAALLNQLPCVHWNGKQSQRSPYPINALWCRPSKTQSECCWARKVSLVPL